MFMIILLLSLLLLLLLLLLFLLFLLLLLSLLTSSSFPSIQLFGDWLQSQSEFKYIIDGANVAYHHQNFLEGKFSYKQIELLVDKMLERGDGKVLVLLPAVYSRHTIPNKCCTRSGAKLSKVKKRRTLISDDDKVPFEYSFFLSSFSLFVTCEYRSL